MGPDGAVPGPARRALLTTLSLPACALAASLVAFVWPQPFVAARDAIVPLLAVVMFGMGLSLEPRDFWRVARDPRPLLLGVALQFLVMPLAAWLITQWLPLPVALAAGLVLVGSCPGGTASNVICFLARGDVALSVAMTSASTLLAVLATPLLTWLYIGERVPVPVAGMLLSVLRIVLLPVSAGMIVNRLAGAWLGPVRRRLPVVSGGAVVLIIAIIVGLNRDQLANVAVLAAVAVVLHNTLGLGAGYALARLAGCRRVVARTIAIEVGMQNSGLGVALAMQHFSPLVAMPGALFSVWHNISGGALAGWWAGRGDQAR